MVLGLQGREFGHWAVLLCVGPVETAATGLVEEMHWSLEESLGDTDQKSKVGVLLKEVVGQHFNRVNRHLVTPSKSLNFEAEQILEMTLKNLGGGVSIVGGVGGVGND
jgi:hypothetical protein